MNLHTNLTEDHTLELEDSAVARQVFGFQNEHIQCIEEHFQLVIGTRGTQVTLRGDRVDQDHASTLLTALYSLCATGYSLSLPDVRRAISILARNRATDLRDIFLDEVFTGDSGTVVRPRGLNQKKFISAMREHSVVFGVGPAGTGKTYLAVAMALAHFFEGRVKRIILTRPAVEAGENLGFLPGDLMEKLDPYLRPLHDAIRNLVDGPRQRRLAEANVIEIAPLAYMRGRTLEDAFVILDEAQNTTVEQMKMFLTRLGRESRAIITGDPTQIDLKRGGPSGLVDAERRLSRIPDIAFCYFGAEDVVRHDLVQKIIRAYEGETTSISET